MNVALDTNVLVYFEGLNDRARRDAAQALVVPTTSTTVAAALELVATHRLQFWDAAILAAAAEAECQLLLSEDMHDGFVWRGVTVANPFASSPHPLLASL